MYFSYLMLRNLGPRTMTATEQRVADEQLGRIAATLGRATRSIAGRRLQAISKVAPMPMPVIHSGTAS